MADAAEEVSMFRMQVAMLSRLSQAMQWANGRLGVLLMSANVFSHLDTVCH